MAVADANDNFPLSKKSKNAPFNIRYSKEFKVPEALLSSNASL
jgi:hypothetical protein